MARIQLKRLFVLATCLSALVACEPEVRTLRLVTPTEPIDASVARELSALLNSEQGHRIELSDTSLAEEAALDALVDGLADIALVSNSLPYRAEISTVLPLYPTVLHVGYSGEGSLFDNPELLRGSRVVAGPEGSASRHIFRRIAERVSIRSDEYQFVEDLEESPTVFVIFSPISPERIDDIRLLRERYPEFHLVSMGDPEEIGQGSLVDGAVLLNPHFQPFVIPARTYGSSMTKPIVTIAVDKTLVARRDLDPTVVYELVSEILRVRPAMAAKRPGLFRRLSEDIDVSSSTYIVHSGTQRFMQRSAPSVYERYSGLAEFAVTLIVALGGALVAVLRVLKRRRKNRIDRFYSKTISLRRSVTESSSQDEIQQVIEQVRNLQTTAFDLLVDEKLAADESFRIFVTLSNDTLRELGDVKPLLHASNN